MEPALSGWRDPVARLRQALAADELELYGQPILALAGEERYPLTELLVRMREEERALLPPGEFLPAFEHYGMLPQLDRWVVTHALARLARGLPPRRLTVNVSAQTLQDGEFAAFVGRGLERAGVVASALLFEIDESDILAQPEAVARFGGAARALGCGLLLDGFGRRSVSFAPLKALRVQYVKVDGSIVRKLLRSPVALTKMTAILRVAEALGIGTVAECVEEEDVLARLKSLGASHAQGFGIHPPQPLVAFR